VLATTATQPGGFVGDAARLNVALTRARRHLFVVGAGGALSASSDLFRRLIAACRGGGAGGGACGAYLPGAAVLGLPPLRRAAPVGGGDWGQQAAQPLDRPFQQPLEEQQQQQQQQQEVQLADSGGEDAGSDDFELLAALESAALQRAAPAAGVACTATEVEAECRGSPDSGGLGDAVAAAAAAATAAAAAVAAPGEDAPGADAASPPGESEGRSPLTGGGRASEAAPAPPSCGWEGAAADAGGSGADGDSEAEGCEPAGAAAAGAAASRGDAPAGLPRRARCPMGRWPGRCARLHCLPERCARLRCPPERCARLRCCQDGALSCAAASGASPAQGWPRSVEPTSTLHGAQPTSGRARPLPARNFLMAVYYSSIRPTSEAPNGAPRTLQLYR
jgi:hypothetical protein